MLTCRTLFGVALLILGVSAQINQYNRLSNQRNLQQNGNPIGSCELGSGASFYDYQSRYSNNNQNNGLQSSLDGIDENHYCPEHWLAYRGQSCIRFYKSPRKDWLHAKKICQAFQGDLINIDSIDKHSFVLKFLLLDNNKSLKYFVSARQTSANTWTNEDNTPLSVVSTMINLFLKFYFINYFLLCRLTTSTRMKSLKIPTMTTT
jgi:hypothetical protein